MSTLRPDGEDRGMEPPVAVLLRAGADGELTPVQQKALAAHLLVHPEDEARMEFEHGLRAACARAMQTGGAPAGLRERIAAAARAAENETEEPAPPTAGHIQRGRRIMASSFLSPGRIALYAAAAIAVAAAGIYYKQQSSPAMLVGQPTTAVQVAGFVEREHDECWKSESRAQSKFTVSDLAQVPGACRGWLGRELSIEQMLAGGVEFVGAGECAVPGPGRSVHLQFRTADGAEPVSLFVQIYRPDGTELPVDEGVVYTLESTDGGAPIVVWRRGGLVYHLLADTEQTSAAMRTAMGVAEPSRQL